MLQNGKIWMAQGDNPCYLLLNQANRHGLIAGASGTDAPSIARKAHLPEAPTPPADLLNAMSI